MNHLQTSKVCHIAWWILSSSVYVPAGLYSMTTFHLAQWAVIRTVWGVLLAKHSTLVSRSYKTALLLWHKSRGQKCSKLKFQNFINETKSEVPPRKVLSTVCTKWNKLPWNKYVMYLVTYFVVALFCLPVPPMSIKKFPNIKSRGGPTCSCEP